MAFLLGILKLLFVLSGIFFIFIGLLTVFYWIKVPPEPNDQSNRINNIKSWWIGLTRPNVLGHAYKSFKQDVLDQLEESNK